MPSCVHLVEAVDAGRRLLGDTRHSGRHLREALRILARCKSRSSSRMTFSSSRAGGLVAGNGAGGFVLVALVDRAGWRRRRHRGSCSGRSRRRARAGPDERLIGAPPVFLERLALPGEDRHALGSPASGPTATAAAAWSWVEKMLQLTQRTSAPSATSVSIRTAVWIVMWSEPMIRAPLSGWEPANSLAGRHQAGHLVLGEADLLAAELGQGEVGDLEVEGGLRRGARGRGGRGGAHSRGFS